MPSAHGACDSFMRPDMVGGQRIQAVSNVDEPFPAKLTFITTSTHGLFQPSVMSLQKAWGLAKTASVINFINQQARLLTMLAGLILTIQTF